MMGGNMFTRRKFRQTTAAGSAVLATSSLAAPAIAQQAAVKLGYVSPQTGPLAGFGEADKFVIDSFLATTKRNRPPRRMPNCTISQPHGRAHASPMSGSMERKARKSRASTSPATASLPC
jgi:hypothetical protein